MYNTLILDIKPDVFNTTVKHLVNAFIHKFMNRLKIRVMFYKSLLQHNRNCGVYRQRG